ncbi:MAG: hypothetical protein JWN02_1575 [Acidobacteria bacterium]|nr:hypothetical protein [Acidobacteriota bacterium]
MTASKPYYYGEPNYANFWGGWGTVKQDTAGDGGGDYFQSNYSVSVAWSALEVNLCDANTNQLLAHIEYRVIGKVGVPGWNRTSDPQLRRLLLYPTELRGHAWEATGVESEPLLSRDSPATAPLNANRPPGHFAPLSKECSHLSSARRATSPRSPAPSESCAGRR